MGEVSGTRSRQVTGSTPGNIGGAENVQGGRTASDILEENDAVVEEIGSQIDNKKRQIKHLEGEFRRLQNQFGPLAQAIAGRFYQDNVDALNGDIAELRGTIERVQREAKKQVQDLTSLDDLLAKGDIEGAFMLVQTNRTLSLDRQIAERLKELQARNDEIKTLNDRLAAINKPDKDLTDPERERKVQLRGQIDKLNADSQLDTIKLQSLINKRNQALEMLTNLLQKFQKVLDSIVGNMR